VDGASYVVHGSSQWSAWCTPALAQGMAPGKLKPNILQAACDRDVLCYRLSCGLSNCAIADDLELLSRQFKKSTHVTEMSPINTIKSSSSTKQWMTSATLSGGHQNGMTLTHAISIATMPCAAMRTGDFSLGRLWSIGCRRFAVIVTSSRLLHVVSKPERWIMVNRAHYWGPVRRLFNAEVTGY